MAELRIAKGQALGNDYLVVERSRLPWPLTPERTRLVCDRHRGVGSDGLLVVEPDAQPVRLRIYNPDGSEAEKSGNGLRILGAWLHHTGRVRAGEPFQVELATDTVTMEVLGRFDDGSLDIVVDMGPARFLAGVDGIVLPLRSGEAVTVHPVSLGNPHCVAIEPALERARFERIGPQLERHAHFPAGTNVQLASVLDRGAARAWIHERGVGETLASGSSASAVAAVLRRLELVDGPDVRIDMPGGVARIHVSDDFEVRLRAPARLVFEAAVLPEQVAAWATATVATPAAGA